jgi:hypothetical protein
MSTRVSLRASFGLWGTGPRESRDRLWCVTVLSGGDDGRIWSQRYKANSEKLASGDLVQVVEVVRHLAGREASCGFAGWGEAHTGQSTSHMLREG